MKQRFTDIAPFIILTYTGLTGFVSSTGWYKVVHEQVLPDAMGYSLLLCYILLKRVYNHPKYCHTTRLAVYGLMAMNIVSIITKNTKYFNPLYDAIITLIILSIVYYLYSKNGNKNDPS